MPLSTVSDGTNPGTAVYVHRFIIKYKYFFFLRIPLYKSVISGLRTPLYKYILSVCITVETWNGSLKWRVSNP